MLTCKQIAHRASDYLAQDLSLWQRIMFRLHLFLCGKCRRFVGQLGLLTAAMKRRPIAQPDDAQIDRWMAHVPDQCGCDLASSDQAPPSHNH
jgi:hypothetical protein